MSSGWSDDLSSPLGHPKQLCTHSFQIHAESLSPTAGILPLSLGTEQSVEKVADRADVAPPAPAHGALEIVSRYTTELERKGGLRCQGGADTGGGWQLGWGQQAQVQAFRLDGAPSAAGTETSGPWGVKRSPLRWTQGLPFP